MRRRAQVLIALLGLGILYALIPYFSGLFGIAALYVLGAPPYRWLVRRRVPPKYAALLVVLGALVVVLIPGIWLVGAVVDQAPSALHNLQSADLLARLSQFRLGDIDVGAQLMRGSDAVVQWFSSQAFGLFGSATRALLNVFIAFTGLYYTLFSADTLWGWLRNHVPFSQARADELRVHFMSVTQATVQGTMAIAVVQGTLIGSGFWLVNLPSPVFWGVATAVASILPVLGSALVWLPGVAILAIQHRMGAAATLAFIGGVLAASIDNIVRPMVYKRVSDIHPMITLVGAFAGVQLFGLIGVLLGPLAITAFFELVRMYEEDYTAR